MLTFLVALDGAKNDGTCYCQEYSAHKTYRYDYWQVLTTAKFVFSLALATFLIVYGSIDQAIFAVCTGRMSGSIRAA